MAKKPPADAASDGPLEAKELSQDDGAAPDRPTYAAASGLTPVWVAAAPAPTAEPTPENCSDECEEVEAPQAPAPAPSTGPSLNMLSLLGLLFVGVTGGGGGGGSGGSGGNSSGTVATFTGVAIDPPVSGARVFLDVNKNGQLDPGEPNTTTDATGNFTLPSQAGVPILATGGIDTGTHLANGLTLYAAAGYTVVSPISTLVYYASQGKDLTQTESQIKLALGLPSTIDLKIYNPFDASASTAQAVAVQKAAAQIVVLLAAAPDAATQLAWSQALANLAASRGADHQTLDLSNASTLQTLGLTAAQAAEVASAEQLIQTGNSLSALTDLQRMRLDSVNEAPVYLSRPASAELAENSPLGTVVIGLKAVDPDHGDSVTYSLIGTDAARMQIDASGNLSLTESPDYETKNTYSAIIVATDTHGLSTNLAFQINISNVNEPPTTSAVTLSAVAEDSGARVITQAELLVNARDIDSPQLLATGMRVASGNGTLVDNGNGSWNYTPASNDDTSVSFSYTCSTFSFPCLFPRVRCMTQSYFYFRFLKPNPGKFFPALPSRISPHRGHDAIRTPRSGLPLRLLSLALLGTLTMPVARAQSLEAMLQEALATHPRILSARATERATQADIEQARTAWNARVNVIADPGRDVGGSNGGGTGASTGDLALRASQLVYDGGKADVEVERHQARADSAHWRLVQASDQLAAQITDLVLETDKQLRLARVASDNVAVHKDLVGKLAEIATIDPGRRSDLTQAQARLQQALVTLQQREATAEEVRAQLASILNKPVPKIPAVRDASNALPDALPLLVDLLPQHPAQLSAQAEVEVARKASRTADLWERPRVDFQGTLQRDTAYLRGHHASVVDLRFVSNWTAFDGGSGRAAADSARQQLQAALDGADGVQRELTTEVTRNWQSLQTRLPRLAAWKALTQQLTEVRDGYWEQFKIARRSILDVLNVEAEIFQARSSGETEQAEVAQIRYRMLAATGRLTSFLGLRQ